VNRIARAHPDKLGEFVALGAQLRDAQVASVRDPSARDRVRDLQRERRRLVDALSALAPDHQDDVARTLTASLVDEEIAARVLSGRLERVPDPGDGFDLLGSALGELPAGAASSAASPSATTNRREQAKLVRAIEDDDDAQARASEAANDVRRLQGELQAAERRALDAARRAERTATARRKLEEDG
jgi:hypothetical protein